MLLFIAENSHFFDVLKFNKVHLCHFPFYRRYGKSILAFFLGHGVASFYAPSCIFVYCIFSFSLHLYVCILLEQLIY